MLSEASEALRHESDEKAGDDGSDSGGDSDGAASFEDAEPGDDSPASDSPEVPTSSTLATAVTSPGTSVRTSALTAQTTDARIESSRSKRWYGRNVERAKLFFGVVPGHDDPDANVLPEEPRGWVPMISPTAVWKSTTGLGGPHQTSELSSSIKSKSIRLIFGRIDCSRRVLEAQPKSLRRNCRISAH